MRGAGLAGAGAQPLDPLKLILDPFERALAVLFVAQLLLGVVADDEAPELIAFAQPDFLDAQVLANLAVAALARERRLGGGLARAHPLGRRSSARRRV